MRWWKPSALVLVAGTGAVLLIAPVAQHDDSRRPSGSGAPATAAAPGTSPGSAAGLSRLVSACRASATLPYSGEQRVRVVGAGGERVSVVAVAHVPGSGVRLTLVSGQGSGGTFVGQLAGPSLLPVVDEATLSRIASRYSVSVPRRGPRIAGQETDVVELVRTSGTATGSVAARFWLDRRTSLPLQREVFDGAGRVQQTGTYLSVTYRPPSAVPRVAAVVGTATDLGQGVTPAQLDALRRNGWSAPGRLPDDFDLVDARVHGTASAGAGTPPRVLQLAYTDGISVVSVFEQRGRLDAGSLGSWAKQRRGNGEAYVDAGTPRRVVWSARGSVYTLVSDDPSVAEVVMGALPVPTKDPGPLDRLQHGVGRLASWVNPFG